MGYGVALGRGSECLFLRNNDTQMQPQDSPPGESRVGGSCKCRKRSWPTKQLVAVENESQLAQPSRLSLSYPGRS